MERELSAAEWLRVICSKGEEHRNWQQLARLRQEFPTANLAADISPERNPFVSRLWPLVAATFFMVSGGTYGTEDIVHGAGYGRAILILLLTPILWSVPTALMVGELSSALPEEGGYYAWVRRGMGRLLGIPGSVAVAGGDDFRHGDLSDAVRRLLGACFPGSRRDIAD